MNSPLKICFVSFRFAKYHKPTKVDPPSLKTRILAGIWMLVHFIFRSQFCHVQPFFKGVCSYCMSNWFQLLLCIYTLFGQAIRSQQYSTNENSSLSR